MLSNDRPPSIWDTHGISGKRFCKSNGVFFSTSSASDQSLEFWYVRTYITACDEWKPNSSSGSEMPVRTRQPEIHSTLVREDSQRIMEQTKQRLQISDPHFDKYTTSATFACWKIRFKTEVCTCSHFPTEAMQWIKEVEMVESVDDLNSSCSVRGIRMPDFEVLDAKNLLQHWTEEQKSPKRGPLPSWKDRSLTSSTSTSGSLEPTVLSTIMPTYLQLFFEMMIFRNSIRNGTEFSCQWRKSHLMTSWKDCTNQRKRESEKLKTVLELYNMEIHQKKAEPDYHRLKTMLKRSIVQNLRIKNFWSQKRKLWEKRRGQESKGKTAWTKKSRRLLAVES